MTSNFKRTHHFLMEVWESLYQFLLSDFLQKEEHVIPTDFLQTALHLIKNLPPSESQESALRNIKELLENVTQKYNVQQKFHDNFKEINEDSIRFWGEFIFRNCAAYIALYLAIRRGQWSLRVAAIKEMAALFAAFDRPKYQKLIPQHIKDMVYLPKDVLRKVGSPLVCLDDQVTPLL